MPRLVPLVMGDSLLGRLRGGAVAILGIAVAVGLGLIGLALEQGAPTVIGGPLPELRGGDAPADSGEAAVVPSTPAARAAQGGGPASAATRQGQKGSAGSHESSLAPNLAGSGPVGTGPSEIGAGRSETPAHGPVEPVPTEAPVSVPSPAAPQPTGKSVPPPEQSGQPTAVPASTAPRGHGRGGGQERASQPPEHARASARAAKPAGPPATKAPKAPKATGKATPAPSPQTGPAPLSAPPGQADPPGNPHGHHK